MSTASLDHQGQSEHGDGDQYGDGEKVRGQGQGQSARAVDEETTDKGPHVNGEQNGEQQHRRTER